MQFPLAIDNVEFPDRPDLLAECAERCAFQQLVIAARSHRSYPVVLEQCDRALPLCRTSSARMLIASLGSLVASYLGQYEEALQRALRVADHYDQTLTPPEQARAAAVLHRALGNAFLGIGDARRAAEEYATGAAACDVSADAWEHSVALYNLAEATVCLGDPERAAQYLERTLEAKSRLEDAWGLSYTHAALANLHASLDEPELALEDAQRALTLANRTGDMKLRSTVHRALGEALHALGRSREANEQLERAVEVASRVGAGPEEVAARAALERLSAVRYGPGRGGFSSSS